MKKVIRNILEVVRCPAVGGTAVPVISCTGVQWNENLKRCPYYFSKDGQQIQCCYHPSGPDKPKTVLSDEQPRTTVRLWTAQDPLISLQAIASTELPPEWRTGFNVVPEVTE